MRVILATFGFVFLPELMTLLGQGSTMRPNRVQSSAEELLQESWQDIDASEYLNDGGSAMVVDSELNVISLGGDDMTEGKSVFSLSEWTQYLIDISKSDEYEYGVAYKEGSDSYWLVLRKPIAVTFSFLFSLNPDAPGFKIDAGFLLIIISVYWIALITFVVVYSKMASKKMTASLEKVAEDASNLEKGLYDVEVTAGETRELDDLGKTMVHLASELKEKEMIRNEEEQKRMLLVSEISHDLKTPLASVQGYSEMLLEDDISEEKRNEYLQVINNNSARANEILQSLLMYSKLGSAGYQPPLEPTDVCELTRQILAEYFPRFETAGFILSPSIPETEEKIMLSKELFRRACDNLLENALKYNPEGTEVKVSISVDKDKNVENEKEWVNLVVADNGIGIPQEAAESIFTPFYRLDSEKPKPSGSGLGLAIVNRIAEMHGGDILFQSGESGGSIFTLRFPK